VHVEAAANRAATAQAASGRLSVVRHGESTANAAFAAGRPGDVKGPDADIPLTPRGEWQAARLGDAIASWPVERRPEVVLCSPYLRARRTHEIAAAAAEARGVTLPAALIDDRLPDRRMGEWELVPWPTIATAGDDVFFDRPPGGESLADVADRLGSLLADINERYRGQRVLLVAHDAIVAVLRYLIEQPSLEDFTRQLRVPAANASITRWVSDGERLRLVEFNRVDHLT
jgi:broad specificity phosphatase PhoE